MEGESLKGTEDCKLEFKENPLKKTFQSVFSKEKSITIPNKIYILSVFCHIKLPLYKNEFIHLVRC